jgi:hydroxymethylglutaryl-CoA reductase (NADPH)
MWRVTMIGQVAGDTRGCNGHGTNALSGLSAACGQDFANVANSQTAITIFEVTPTGDLYISVTLTSLTVATVGGGTHLPTSRECLELLGCYGAGRAPRLAEIAAATFLAGELSMGAAIETHEIQLAHENRGRNRPEPLSAAVEEPLLANGAMAP